MRNIKFKKVISCVLAVTLCLSAGGCGKGKTVVDDYGAEAGGTDTAATSSTYTDGISVESGNGQALRDIYGKKVEWKDEFNIKGIPFEMNINYTVPELDGLNVYTKKAVNDGKADEEKIVEALFGDSAKKLEELKYVNETDYMPMMYKYREIKQTSEYYMAVDDSEADDEWIGMDRDYTIITSASTESFKWVDDQNMYIHMYEGDYKGERFGLILAYDYVASVKYIFFEPISIKDYYPEHDFKSLYVAESNTMMGEPIEYDNKCTKSMSDIRSEADTFLKDKLQMGGVVETTESSEIYKFTVTDNLASFMNSTFITGSFVNIERGNSVLMFSDSDYLSTIRAGTEGQGVDYSILAEQKDLYAEYLASHEGSEISVYEFLASQGQDIKEAVGEPNFYVDGYALFLGTEYDALAGDFNYMSTFNMGLTNKGIIKVTSKGIYGVDLEICEETTDVVENVKLLDTEKIKESIKEELADRFEPEKLENPSTVQVRDMSLNYAPYSEDNSKEEYMTIPIWNITLLGNYDGTHMASVRVNAMDGSIIDINYWSFE